MKNNHTLEICANKSEAKMKNASFDSDFDKIKEIERIY